MFGKSESNLRVAQQEAQQLFIESGQKPKLLSPRNITTFFSKLRYSIALTFQEKEIIILAMLQWIFIIIGYILWTKGLQWIPDEVWQGLDDDKSNKEECIAGLIITGWSFAVIVIISYPISIFSSAIVASQYLRHSNQDSTIAKCVAIALRSSGRLWLFTAIDSWITCNAILDRLPKKRGPRRTALDELLYYAWKIGTAPVLPALVAGKGFVDAAKDSITILRNEPMQLIGIRMGYSLICWIVAIISYGGSIYVLKELGQKEGTTAHYIYNSYLLMVIPIFFSVGIISVLVRPHFLIMMAKLYNEVITVDNNAISFEENNSESLFWSKLFLTIFTLLFVGLIIFYFYCNNYFESLF